jgi:hypothetical protein
MAEVLQKGSKPKTAVTAKDTMAFYGRAMSGGAAGAAAKDLTDTQKKREQAVGYKDGGMVKMTPKSTKYARGC